MSITESIVEDAALEWFEELGYVVGLGPQTVPRSPAAKRDSFCNICAGQAVESISERRIFNANRKSVIKGE